MINYKNKHILSKNNGTVIVNSMRASTEKIKGNLLQNQNHLATLKRKQQYYNNYI